MSLNEILKPGMKGVFYGRYSTKKQDIEMQKHSSYYLCKQYQCDITKEFIDRGVSATKKTLLHREKLVAMLKEAELNKFDFIVTYNGDRLARDPYEHQFLREQFKNLGVPVILSCYESLYDVGDLVSQLVKDGMTKYESDTTRDRTRDTFIYKVRKGEWTGGTTPFGYGYDKQNKRIYIIESEAGKVRDMYNLYKQGLGFKMIARKMPEAFNKGKPWTKEKVKSIITNPFYAGVTSMNKKKEGAHNSLKDRKEWITGESEHIPAIIETELWEYCFKSYEDRKKGLIKPRHFQTPFLLKGLLICKNCNDPLIPKNQRKELKNGTEYGTSIYKCQNCKYQVDATDLHDFVEYHLLNVVLFNEYAKSNHHDFYNQVIQSFKKDKQIIQNDLFKIKKEINALEEQGFQVDREIRKKLKKEKKDEFLPILQLFRDENDKKIKRSKDLQWDKEQAIYYIETVLEDFDFWFEIYKDDSTHKPHDKEKAFFRRMFIHLFDKVIIEPKKSSRVNAKGNHLVGPIKSEFTLEISAKMNMETMGFAEIEGYNDDFG